MKPLAAPSREAPADAGPKPLVVALAGNPNTGKTSLFNALTGMRQRVGNYPGVTVERKTGRWNMGSGNSAQLVDLPGTYSLSATSPDERIVVDVLSGRMQGTPPPDVVVVVLDAENLQRNLFLASQIADLELPMVLAVNLYDVAERKGVLIDCKLLEQRLGVPVVPTVATRRTGIDDLARAVAEAAASKRTMIRIEWPPEVAGALARLRESLDPADGAALNDAELQRLLFDGSSAVRERVGGGRREVAKAIETVRAELYKAGHHPEAAETTLRHRQLNPLLQDIVERRVAARRSRSESIDRILLHRFWGLAIFVAMMYVVFQSVYSWAGPIMDLIEGAKAAVQSAVAPLLAATPMLQSLVVDGAIEGVGAFLVFLPQILFLFFFIALLEESGYMARAAFLMDKLFRWCGLNGKSFVPLLSSYACAVPGILATRTIGDPKARVITILIAPLMSCSARLPVYLLLIGAFVEPVYGPAVAGATLFLMHLVGALVAAPAAWVLNRCIGRTPATAALPFVMELPHYRPPQPATLFWRMYESGKDFVIRAGTIIFAMTVVIWALLYFPRPPEVADRVRAEMAAEAAPAAALDEAELERRTAAAYVEQSLMGRAGKTIQPLFEPAGYDWKITVGVLASFPAREVIISTLGVIYSLGGEVDEASPTLRSTLARARWESGPRAGEPIFTIPVAASIMVFFALCLQCGATVAVIAKELDWRWAWGAFAAMTLLAWVGAVIVYQAGTALL